MSDQPCPICNEPHDPTKCQGHANRSGGKQCTSPPHSGDTDRCYWHGGRPKTSDIAQLRRPANRDTLTPVATQAKRRVQRDAIPLLPAGRLVYEPLWNPLEELHDLAGRMKGWMEFLETKVAALTKLGLATETGVHLMAEVALYERSMTNLAATLMGIARLNIDERLVRLEEAKADMILAAFEAALAAVGIDGDRAVEARTAAVRHLRIVATEPPAA